MYSLNTVNKKIIATIVLTMIIIGVSFGGILYYRTRNDIINNMKDEAEKISNRISHNISVDLWDVNMEQVNKILDDELMNRYLFGVAIEGVNSGIYIIKKQEESGAITEIDPTEDITQIFKKSIFEIKSTIKYSDIEIAKMTLYFDKKYMKNQLDQLLRRVIISVLGAIFGIIIIVYHLLKKLVIKPIIRLKENVQEIENKNFHREIQVKSNDEIGELSKSFNNMRRRLKSYIENIETISEDRKRLIEEVKEKNEKLSTFNTRLQEKVKERTYELEVTNESLRDSLIELEKTQNELVEKEKMASLGNLVSGVAHEINTPVGVSVSAASFLKDRTQLINKHYISEEMEQQEFEDYIENAMTSSDMILNNLQKASKLVQSFKKIAVDQHSDQKRVVALKKYIENTLDNLQYKTKKKNLDIIVDCPENLKIESYPGAISQIISNLVINSLIHGFENRNKGKIKIKVKQEENMIQIIYMDDGKGIKKKNLHKIFDPFYTTKRGDGGSGLGMHIIYNLVSQKLGGDIYCESSKGEGTKFYMKFPIE